MVNHIPPGRSKMRLIQSQDTYTDFALERIASSSSIAYLLPCLWAHESNPRLSRTPDWSYFLLDWEGYKEKKSPCSTDQGG